MGMKTLTYRIDTRKGIWNHCFQGVYNSLAADPISVVVPSTTVSQNTSNTVKGGIS